MEVNHRKIIKLSTFLLKIQILQNFFKNLKFKIDKKLNFQKNYRKLSTNEIIYNREFNNKKTINFLKYALKISLTNSQLIYYSLNSFVYIFQNNSIFI